MPTTADEKYADANIFAYARNTVLICRRLQRIGIQSYYRQHRQLETQRLASVSVVHGHGYIAHARTYMQQCDDAANTSVCVHGHIRVNVLVSTSLLRCLCVRSLPITLSGEWPEGRGEQLAVTPVPRTSSGPVRQLKLDVCALSASSNSYESLQQSKCY